MTIALYTSKSVVPVRGSANYVVGIVSFALEPFSPVNSLRWLNVGWNAGTKLHEQWESTPHASALPPSGNSLTGISSYPIGPSQ